MDTGLILHTILGLLLLLVPAGALYMLERQMLPKFAVAVFDINGLKEINDTYGHQMGDQYIIDGCKIISKVYRNSPIYRLGGDEFAIIARGADYARIDELMEKFLKESEKNRNTGGVVVAAGMSKYVDEKNVAEVFRTADKRMYKNKEELKR
jgi:diguanylate cyclase (GGDEF)-like protein